MSNLMSPKTLRRSVFAAAVVAASAFGITATAPVSQAATTSSCTYYSDASHTTVVGEFGKDCCNNTVARGHKTPYFVCGGCIVCVPPPPR